ncbi:hypothetical protein DPMN_022722 [Dreissena polymorpha]|uniref:Uncharacterized protein n=1 Tax=Dreissena polymorpha TaxID=45954 RepID=A0A9D4NQI9_DREPO|nr:hypothetical protein DPMN_022722 [Dreissena polymorpha]
MKAKRFLALCGYIEGSDVNAVMEWKEHIEVHDTYLNSSHRPGTVRTEIFLCIAFLKWCKYEGHANANKVDHVPVYRG